MAVTNGDWVRGDCISQASGFLIIPYLYGFEEGLWNHLQAQCLGNGAPGPLTSVLIRVLP